MREGRKQETRLQHWVPRFYLRYFSTAETRDQEKPRAWFFDKSEVPLRAKLAGTHRLCGKTHLYSPADADGVRDQSVERMLAGIEGRTGSVWRALAEDHVDLTDPTVRTTIATFCAAMHLRNVAILDLVEKTINSRLKLYGELPETYEPIRGMDARNPQKFFVGQLVDSLPRITEDLLGKQWIVLTTENEILCTSDRPYMFIRKGNAMAGPRTLDTIAVIAISPCRLLVMLNDGRAEFSSYVKRDDEFIKEFNRETWNRSLRLVITGRGPDSLAEELGINAEPPNDGR